MVIINKELAQAIIDMENIGYSESLGPKSFKRHKEWSKLVRNVAKEFDLQNSIDCGR